MGAKGRGEELTRVPAPVSLPVASVLAVGLGDADKIDAEQVRRSAGTAARALTGVETVATTLSAVDLGAAAEGFALGAYTYTEFRSEKSAPKEDARPVARVELLVPSTRDRAAKAALTRSVAIAEAVATARNFVNTPPSHLFPAEFAERAKALGEAAGLKVEILDEKALEKKGFGGIVGVGKGSSRPPRLVRLSYSSKKRKAPKVALVGKGITFDTGGISIKPREAMVGMKTDMAGAAAVLATVLAAAELGVPHRVVGVLALAENAVGAGSYRPGDVVRAYDGTTIEVSNTDAEGRMVLADAMAWVRDTARPDVLVDVATLTGAVTLGLGRTHAGLYATDDALAAALEAAGEVSGERAWRLPLVESYRPSLDSAVADISHQSRDPHIMGGSITAALFLQHFAGDTPWAHLDIAGAGRATKARHHVPEGPTGYGARLLLRWLQDLT